MNEKKTFLLKIWNENEPQIIGTGECNLFEGLSAEDSPDYPDLLRRFCENPQSQIPEVASIRFGFETAMWSLKAKGNDKLFDTPFTSGLEPITINGLVWMGDRRTMLRRMHAKLEAGFHCVKIKIGGIDFEEELSLLKSLRKEYNAEDVELRLDANGAFTPDNAAERLKRLSEFKIHSIEQPIRQGQYDAMRDLCEISPIPIALDEDLIGFHTDNEKAELLDTIRPQYIILKPALCGGFAEADSWIRLAENRNIGWWATSALESNVGLNAIAQWVSRYRPTIPQGLGTGALYANNFPTRCILSGDKMWFRT